MRICFIASPLTARSGVYNSARELVNAGREAGLEWSLLLGVSRSARGDRPDNDPSWIVEEAREPDGIAGVRALRAHLRTHDLVRDSDIVVSLIPQTDLALAGLNKSWIAFTRGLPWPEAGEAATAKRLIWRALELRALKRADRVWATTPILRGQLGLRGVDIVPAGVKRRSRTWNGEGDRRDVVWAARFDTDKRPELFLKAMEGSALRGIMYGSGRLQDVVTATAPENVTVSGWRPSTELWTTAMAYAGTSTREAFGRSAVEAAMNGIPVVLTKQFGCADLLVRDRRLSRLFVLDDDPDDWRRALDLLHRDEDLRREYSDHLVHTSRELTIEASALAVESALTRTTQ